MRQPLSAQARIVEGCGGFERAIDVAVGLCRRLWELEFGQPDPGSREEKRRREQEICSEARLRAAFGKLAEEQPGLAAVAEDVFTSLLQPPGRELPGSGGEGGTPPPRPDRFSQDFYNPIDLAARLLRGVRPEHDIHYFVIRNIRRQAGCSFHPAVAGWFHHLASSLNGILLKAQPEGTPREKRKTKFPYQEIIVQTLQLGLDPDGESPDVAARIVRMFLESCLAVRYVRVAPDTPGSVQLTTTGVDAEFLLSHLFGVPTRVPGFDGLFGGGGVLFVEREHAAGAEQFPARTMVIKGRFGTGKSLLALSLAVEVARKGGLALYFALEQSYPECLYMLETMNGLPRDGSFAVSRGNLRALRSLQNPSPGAGLLVILTLDKENYHEFLASLKRFAEIENGYALRLLCVDPVNSIHTQQQPPGTPNLRTDTAEAFNAIKAAGTNLILTSEDNPGAPADPRFEENIADTVVRLSVDDTRHSYAQRYLEVTKSRLQREQRGRHPFSIKPGAGLVIFPSSGAVRARNATRYRGRPTIRGEFGLPSLDRILGPEPAITAGDLVVLNGPIGSFKTQLGLLFLMTYDNKAQARAAAPTRSHYPANFLSLFVTSRYDDLHVQEMRREQIVRHTPPSDPGKPIWACTLRGGFVSPGAIFHELESQLEKAKREEYIVDRVFLDDLPELDNTCPFITDDKTFGDTLVDYLRRHHITTLATYSDGGDDPGSTIQRSLVESADTLVELDRFEHRGRQRVLVRVQRTPSMAHRREAFELTADVAGGLAVSQTPSLLRLVRGQGARLVTIRLFLHAESPVQEEYNLQVRDTVRALLSPETHVEPQYHIPFARTELAGSLSAIDELQILQLDEFQVKREELELHPFPREVWEAHAGQWDHFQPRLLEKVKRERGGFAAVPYYDNLSLLAFRSACCNASHLASWAALAERCRQLEAEHPDRVVFDFPHATPESYNCLFFEVLQSLRLAAPPGRGGPTPGCLACWLEPDDTVEAGWLFRRLCRRAHWRSASGAACPAGRRPPADDGSLRRDGGSQAELPRRYFQAVDPEALVWRHWFTTLRQMMAQLPPEEHPEVAVAPLPGRVTTAGEWYLAVPAGSAAQEVSLEVIKLLTSRVAELERFRRGVGLPTRSSIFPPHEATTPAEEGGPQPYKPLDLGLYAALATVTTRPAGPSDRSPDASNPFRRSQFNSYSQFAPILADHLKQIIELGGRADGDAGGETGIRVAIREILDRIQEHLRFVGANDCPGCQKRAHRGPQARDAGTAEVPRSKSR